MIPSEERTIVNTYILKLMNVLTKAGKRINNAVRTK